MTKKDSLELAIILWNWLAANPLMNKNSCPHVNVMSWRGACPFCQYATQVAVSMDRIDEPSCEDCPLYGRWPSHAGPRSTCWTGAYRAWERKIGYEYDLSFFCLVLVESFQELLEELREERDVAE